MFCCWRFVQKPQTNILNVVLCRFLNVCVLKTLVKKTFYLSGIQIKNRFNKTML